MIMNSDLGEMWEEHSTVSFKVLSWHAWRGWKKQR